MPTIFLVIANYIQITDLIHSGLLAELSRRFKVVALLPTLDGVSSYPQSSNIVYHQWDIQSPDFWGRFKLLRVGLITVFDSLLSIQVHYLRAFQDWRRRWLRAFALVFPFKFTPEFFTCWETRLLPSSAQFQNLLQTYRPQALFLGTPGFTDLEAEIVILSRRAGLPTVALNFSWDNLTTNAKHIRKTDFLVVWNEAIRQEALFWHHYLPDRVLISGPLRFNHYFPESLKPAIYKPQAEPLLLVTTTSHGVYPYHVDLLGHLLRLREEKAIPFCRILIRVHPKDDIGKYQNFAALPGVTIELAGGVKPLTGGSRHKIELRQADFAHLHELFRVAAVAINYCSTMTLEALAVGCPVINITFPSDPLRRHYEYEHYLPIIKSGAVWVAGNPDQLAEGINHYLLDRVSNKIEREDLVNKFFYRTDGLAHQRCADIVQEIVETKL